MTPPVAFPDVVELVVDDLRAYLVGLGDTATVAARVPNPRPERLVRVERTGGPRRNPYVDGPQITVSAWAPTENGAHHLAELCRRRINTLSGRVLDGHAFYRVEEAAGPARLPDPDSDAPRYVATWRLSVRGTAP